MKKNYILTKTGDFNYTLTINNRNNNYAQILINFLLIVTQGFSDNNDINFIAESVQTLEDLLKKYNYLLPEALCFKMIDHISKQINYYRNNNILLYGFDLKDILVINYSIFVIINVDYMMPIKNNLLHIYLPITKPYFSNPEIYEITSLPTNININCIYYSIGVLVTFCLLNKYLLVGNEILSKNQIENILKPLYGKKIYYFLMRCLEDEPEKRHLILI